MIAWLLISFFVLLFLGVPIAMSLGLSAIGGILFLGGGSTVTIAQRMFEGMNSWALLAIPLYTFAGYTMSKGGISKRLMDFCYSIVGHIYGGLAHVNVLSSMIFAGISGSAVADTAGDWYLITSNGKATEKIEEREAKAHIIVQDLTIETPVVSELVTVHGQEGEELSAQGRFDALTKLLAELESADLVKQISAVSVPSSYHLTVYYGDRFEVDLGNTDSLDYKLEYLKTVVAMQKEYATGTIDLSFSEGKEAHVLLN